MRTVGGSQMAGETAGKPLDGLGLDREVKVARPLFSTTGMDIARPDLVRKKKRRRILYGAGAALGLLLLTLGVSRLKPAAPGVDRAAVWIDEVKRGPMLRQVRGLGTLVPEEIRWIAATTDGRVERRVILPGREVKADAVILVLSNPELEQQALEAISSLRASEAALAELRVRLESQRLNQEADLGRMESEYRQARLQADADEQLARQGLVADLTRQLSSLAADEMEKRAALEKRRLAIADEAIRAQIAVQEAEVEQRRALARLRQSQVDGLKVRAGIEGVLQQVPVEVGQQVGAGTNLARISQPDRLKAMVRIAETQARDVQIGLEASVDTRNGIIPGRVSRVDPAVENGTVTVDIELLGALPKGARPDLTVDGTIEIERLEDVLYVGRPTQGQPGTTVGLFRLVPGSDEAHRVRVELGRASVSTIEIRGGLAEGDRVILSDTSAWDAHDRIRLD
jgi:HlyD family secretion protein